MSRMADRQAALGERWLLLVHQLPAQPAYLRVKLWRRLQSLGAIPIKNGVHVLPSTAEALEDFEWLRKEFASSGGDATIVEGRLVDGLSDHDLKELFSSARAEEYCALADEARQLATPAQDIAPRRTRDSLNRLQAKLERIAAIDFFGSAARASAEAAVRAAADAHEEAEQVEPTVEAKGEYSGKRWVTRSGVYIDRIASAWFITRFVDPGAEMKFVPARHYGPRDGEIRFDMFEAEFTHVGDACTMEVLARHFRPDDEAAKAVAEIVHDVDLKDGKFGRSEAEGIRTLISGICARTSEDAERVERGKGVFDDLYAYFEKSLG